MRTLTSAALHGAIVTLAAIAALRATDPVLTVAVVALVVVLLTWFAALAGDDDTSRLDATGTLAGLTLAIVGRSPWGNLLPVLAIQAVVAVAIGAAANALADQLGPTLVIGEPSLATAAIAAALAGVTVAWVVLAIDGTAPAALAAVPAVVAGGVGPIARVDGGPAPLGRRGDRRGGIGRRGRHRGLRRQHVAARVRLTPNA